MSQTENGARRRSNRRGVGREMEDEEEGPVLRAKVKHLAQLVRESKYAVVCFLGVLSLSPCELNIIIWIMNVIFF